MLTFASDMASDEGQAISQKFVAVSKAIRRYERGKFDEWKGVPNKLSTYPPAPGPDANCDARSACPAYLRHPNRHRMLRCIWYGAVGRVKVKTSRDAKGSFKGARIGALRYYIVVELKVGAKVASRFAMAAVVLLACRVSTAACCAALEASTASLAREDATAAPAAATLHASVYSRSSALA